jgi:hypothetical protein
MPFGTVGGGYQLNDGNLNEVAMLEMQDPGAAKTTAVTLTLPELTGGVVVTNFGSALALTTPTAAQIDGYLTNAKVGSTFNLSIVQTAAFAASLTGGVGVTVVGVAATAAPGSAMFTFRKTGVGTWSAYRMA